MNNDHHVVEGLYNLVVVVSTTTIVSHSVTHGVDGGLSPQTEATRWGKAGNIGISQTNQTGSG